MIVKRAGLRTDRGRIEVFLLPFAKDRRRDERHDLIQHCRVACRHGIVVNDQRQEVEVVSDPCANADTGRWVPPMLDIPLLELPRCRAQNLCPRFIRSAVDQSHHILELVSKAVRSSGLVKGGAGPNAAGPHLIKEPTVEHQVHAGIGRRHM